MSPRGAHFVLQTGQWSLACKVIPYMVDAVNTGWIWSVFERIGQYVLGGAEDEEEARRVEIEEKERQFHGVVRENIIFFLLFISIYLLCYWMISRYRSRMDSDSLYSGVEDIFVYRISIWMCTVALTVSFGSIALLPFSIVGAELLQRYPENYYLQWLSWSLIHNLWNYVFAISMLSLFVLLPFAYFFIESQGFNKKKSGLLQRAYETGAVCVLLVIVLLCLSDLIFSLFLTPATGGVTFAFGVTSLNLPLLYSIVSLLGVALLLVSAPIGFTRVFTIVSDMALVTPPDLDDVTLERLEICCQKRRLLANGGSSHNNNGFLHRNGAGSTPSVPTPKTHTACSTPTSDYGSTGYARRSRIKYDNTTPTRDYSAGPHGDVSVDLAPLRRSCSDDDNLSYNSANVSSCETLSDASSDSSPISRRTIPLQQKSLRWYQQVLHTIKYILMMLAVLALTTLSVLLVLINALKLGLGYRALPVYAQYIEVNSRHSFGLIGVALEIVIILYIMATSIVGIYSMPLLRTLRPQRGKTSMTAVILNCSTILVLSSALPVLANTLGLTTFDLLGAYSSLKWLSNFRLVITYNFAFAGVTMLLLFNQLTSPVRQQIIKRVRDLRMARSGAESTTLPPMSQHEKEE